MGVEKFVKAFPATNSLFVFPESISVLEERLNKRGTETEESLKIRMKNATHEIKRGLDKDEHLVGYRLVNKDLEKARPAFVSMVEALYTKDELECNN